MSIIVQAPWLPRVEPLLPGGFQPDYIRRIHVGRNTLKDAEPEVVRVTVAEEAVPTVADSPVVSPPPQKVLTTIRRSHIPFAVRSVEDVVDRPPFGELDLKAGREHTQVFPTQIEFIPARVVVVEAPEAKGFEFTLRRNTPEVIARQAIGCSD
jgi:hypothetical protein